MANYLTFYKLMNSDNKKRSLRISCSNVRGLNKSPKLGSKMTHILNHLDTDIKVIIDSHTDKYTLNKLRKEYKIEMAKYSIIGNFSKDRGIMVLTKKSSGYSCSNAKLVDKTNTLQFDLISPDGVLYNIVAIYAPDGSNATYWTELHDKMDKKKFKQILIGDFNVTLDPYLDRTNYKMDNHTKGREVINSWLQREEYIDAYRYIYPTTRGFSWRWDGNKGNPSRDLKGRLDHYLVIHDMLENLINVNYQYTTASDHASIIIEIGTGAEEHGKGTFRAPPYIHNDKIYHKQASEVIIDTILDNKVSSEDTKFLKECLLTKRATEENYYNLLNNEEQTEVYLANLNDA